MPCWRCVAAGRRRIISTSWLTAATCSCWRANERDDKSAIAACTVAGIALMNMKDRHSEKGKIGATGDEIQALELLVDASEDFWKRQSGALFVDAEAALSRAREMREEESGMSQRQHGAARNN